MAFHITIQPHTRTHIQPFPNPWTKSRVNTHVLYSATGPIIHTGSSCWGSKDGQNPTTSGKTSQRNGPTKDPTPPDRFIHMHMNICCACMYVCTEHVVWWGWSDFKRRRYPFIGRRNEAQLHTSPDAICRMMMQLLKTGGFRNGPQLVPVRASVLPKGRIHA